MFNKMQLSCTSKTYEISRLLPGTFFRPNLLGTDALPEELYIIVDYPNKDKTILSINVFSGKRYIFESGLKVRIVKEVSIKNDYITIKQSDTE